MQLNIAMRSKNMRGNMSMATRKFGLLVFTLGRYIDAPVHGDIFSDDLWFYTLTLMPILPFFPKLFE
jgi:hypothetical protein